MTEMSFNADSFESALAQMLAPPEEDPALVAWKDSHQEEEQEEYLPEGKGDEGIKLQEVAVAVKLDRTRWHVSKVLDASQRSTAADAFDAKGSVLSASKHLIDKKDSAYKAVMKVLQQARAYWTSMTMPYREMGVRLLNKKRLATFKETIADLQDELAEKGVKLDETLPDLIKGAKHLLGDLFNPADYPLKVSDLFSITVDYPSIHPDERLKEIDPEIYEQEVKKVQAKLQAAAMEMQVDMEEKFAGLLSHLVEKLKGLNNGDAKQFRKTTLTNLEDFFDRFEDFSFSDEGKMTELVQRAKNIVNGVELEEIKNSAQMRTHLADKMGEVSVELEHMLESRPSRQIVFDDDEED